VKNRVLILFLTLFFMSNTSCENKEEEKEIDTFTCEVTAKAHNGCCSHHKGAKDCGSGAYYYNQGGGLQCNDDTTSPSCTW
jgi:hypothetical protein